MRTILLVITVALVGCATAPDLAKMVNHMIPIPAKHTYIEQVIHTQQIILGANGKPVGRYYIKERRVIAEKRVNLTKAQIDRAKAGQKYGRGHK